MIPQSEIKSYIISRYQAELAARGLGPDTVGDQFDLLTSGLVDSLGVLELVSAVEDHFRISVDLEDLDAESLTIFGPLTEYIATKAVPREAPPPAPL